MRRLVGSVLTAVVVLAAGRGYAGPQWQIGDDTNCWMKLGILGQAHFLNAENAPDKGDFYLRRARIILSGQVIDGVKLFLETDAPNSAKNGGATSRVDIQDAFVDFRLNKNRFGEHWIKAGMILLPFSFENRAGASSLLGIDYNTEALKLVNTLGWRDYGGEFHGNISDRFSYMIGHYDGYDSDESLKNPGASVRLTGHIALNIVGKVETDWFFNQERLGKGAPYFSIGAGIDKQDEATLTHTAVAGTTNKTAVITDSDAWVVDFQSGFQAGLVGLTLNGGWYNWDNVTFKGDTACVEGGAMVKQTQLTAKYSLQNADAQTDIEDYTVGLNYFFKGHNARGGVEYRWGDSPTTVLVGLQFLL